MLKQGLTLLSAVILILGAVSVTAAERYMYKWKSADGELHYTERPPKDIPFEKIRVVNDDRAAAANKTSANTDQASKQNDDIKAADSSYRTWRKDNCRIAKQNLDILNNAGRISTDDGQGGKRLMTDEEKAASKKKAQMAIDKFCGESSETK